MSTQPIASTAGSPVAAVANGSQESRLDSFIQKQLNAPDPNGKPNMFQLVDKMNISPQAKLALETTMARQELSYHHDEQGKSSPSQNQFVFNGSVYKAVQALSNGTGSMQNVVAALHARGMRMEQVESGQTPATPSPNQPPAQ